MAASGDHVVAVATASNRVDATGSTGATAYTGALTGGAAAGTSFIAPPSGKVTILFGTAGFNSGANDNKSAVRVGTGGTVGGGTTFYAADDKDMILFTGAATYAFTGFAEIAGLTPGATYNVQMQHRVSAGTGSFLYKRVKVIPDL